MQPNQNSILFHCTQRTCYCDHDHVLYEIYRSKCCFHVLFVFACLQWCQTHIVLCFCYCVTSFSGLSIFYCPFGIMFIQRAIHKLTTGFVTRLTRRVPLVKQELPNLPEHLSSPPVFSGVRVTRSLVLYVCFVDRCFSFCTFSFDHCVFCSPQIYGF